MGWNTIAMTAFMSLTCESVSGAVTAFCFSNSLPTLVTHFCQWFLVAIDPCLHHILCSMRPPSLGTQASRGRPAEPSCCFKLALTSLGCGRVFQSISLEPIPKIAWVADLNPPWCTSHPNSSRWVPIGLTLVLSSCAGYRGEAYIDGFRTKYRKEKYRNVLQL